MVNKRYRKAIIASGFPHLVGLLLGTPVLKWVYSTKERRKHMVEKIDMTVYYDYL